MNCLTILIITISIQINVTISVRVSPADVPIIHKNGYNCREITREKNKCVEDANSFLAWRWIVSGNTETFLQLNDTNYECLIRCIEEPQCVLINIVGNNQCWLASYLRRGPGNYPSAILNCCPKDVKVDAEEMHSCEKITEQEKAKQVCENDQKNFYWRTDKSTSFNSSWKIYGNYYECRKRCLEEPNCHHVKYNWQNECWLAGILNQTEKDDSFDTLSLVCCKSLPIYLKNSYDCERLTAREKANNKCDNAKKTFLWQSEVATTFESSWQTVASFDYCRRLCLENSTCLKVSYNNNSKCLFGLMERTVRDYENEYNTSTLYCCNRLDSYNCDSMTVDERRNEKCEIYHKTFHWMTETAATIESSGGVLVDPVRCKQMCLEDTNCLKVAYSIVYNICYLSGNVPSVRDDVGTFNSFNTSTLICCKQIDEVPIDPNNTYDCERLTDSEMKCSDKDMNNDLVWKTVGLQNTSFDASRFFKAATIKECRRLCATDLECNQIAYNEQFNYCLLGFSRSTYANTFYNTSFLFCCGLEKKVNVRIETSKEQGPDAGSGLGYTVQLNHWFHLDCTHYQYISSEYETKPNDDFLLYTGSLNNCPKTFTAYDFKMKLIYKTSSNASVKWIVRRAEVKILGYLKLCFPYFDEVGIGRLERTSEPCPWDN